MIRSRLSLLLPVVLMLGACAADGVVPPSRPPARPAPRPVVKPVPRPVPRPLVAPPAPHVLAAPGLEGVIGANRADLFRLFGPPRLDVQEGDARKLQYSGGACVLDVYLYPPRGGGDPRATYVDARRAADARDVDRAACVAALRKK